MGPRYTKAIIMLVVGSPVLAAGIIIENSLEAHSAQNSTITIARLMIAAGTCMVAVGIFVCCIIITTNKKEEPRLATADDVQLQRVSITPARPQPTQRGVQLVTYSPLTENQNVPPQASRFNKPQVVNSPVTRFQSAIVTNTSGNLTGSSQTDSSMSRISGQQLLNPSYVQIQSSNPSVTQSQHSNTSDPKSQRSNTSQVKIQQPNKPVKKNPEKKGRHLTGNEIRSQRTYVSQAKSQRLNAAEAKQRSNNSDSKYQRLNQDETKIQRSSVVEPKNIKTNIVESKSQRSVASEAKSCRSSASESKSYCSNKSVTKSQCSDASETRSQNSNCNENRTRNLKISDLRGENPSAATQNKIPNQISPTLGKQSGSTSDIPNPVHLPCFSTPRKIVGQSHSISSESLIYPVNASDMARLLTAAKKVMDPRTFQDIAKTYSIVYSSSSSTGSQGELTTSGDFPIKRHVVRTSLSTSLGQLSESPGKGSQISLASQSKDPVELTATLPLGQRKDQVQLAATLPLGQNNSPSAPPYHGSSPEIDPPPYSP